MPLVFMMHSHIDTGSISQFLINTLRNFNIDVFYDFAYDPRGNMEEFLGNIIKGVDILIIVVGENLFAIKDDAGKRKIDDPNNWIHISVVAAIQQNKAIIPVLVNDAPILTRDLLPSPLANLADYPSVRLNQLTFRENAEHLANLILKLGKVAEEKRVAALTNLTNKPIFISHSSKDDDFVSTLTKTLQTNGLKTWVDHQNIKPGEDWDASVERALEEAAVMILVLSTHSVQSYNVKVEWSLFLDLKKQVFPILIEECKIPFRLKLHQLLNFASNQEKATSDLLKILMRK